MFVDKFCLIACKDRYFFKNIVFACLFVSIAKKEVIYMALSLCIAIPTIVWIHILCWAIAHKCSFKRPALCTAFKHMNFYKMRRNVVQKTFPALGGELSRFVTNPRASKSSLTLKGRLQNRYITIPRPYFYNTDRMIWNILQKFFHRWKNPLNEYERTFRIQALETLNLSTANFWHYQL